MGCAHPFSNPNDLILIPIFNGALPNFIQQSLNSEYARVQILLAACRRFAMVKISNCVPSWKYGLMPFVGQPFRKNNSSSSSFTLIIVFLGNKKIDIFIIKTCSHFFPRFLTSSWILNFWIFMSDTTPKKAFFVFILNIN